MNLVPYVMLMLVIVSITVSSVIHNSLGLGVLTHGECEYMKRHRSARSLLHNTVAEALKKELNKSASRKSKVENPSEVKQPYISTRRTHFLRKSAKLNLMPLLKAPESSGSVLNETFVSLLTFLYGHLDEFKNPETLKRLAAHILAKGREALRSGKTELEYLDIYPTEPPYSDLFYLIMTGSKNYHVENYIGIPPLCDFLILDSDEKEKAICFHGASFPLLVAHFGPSFTDEILKAEQEKSLKGDKRVALTKVELSNLIANQSSLRQKSALLLAELDYVYRKKDAFEVSGKNGAEGPIQVRLSQPKVTKRDET